MEQKPTDFIIGRRNGSKRTPTMQELAATQSVFLTGKDVLAQQGVLIVHGFGSSPLSLKYIIDTLNQTGYTVSAPLLAGHGTHLDDYAQTTWQQWYQSVETSYQQLRQQCQQVYVLGQSMGGLLALQLAHQFPEVKKLFLLVPALGIKAPVSLVKLLLKILMRFGCKYTTNVGGDIKNSTRTEITYKSSPLASIVTLCNCIEDTRKLLPNIKIPTVAFYSSEDHVIGSQSSEYWLKKLGSESLDIVWLKNSYHLISNDNERELIIKRVLHEIQTRG